MHGCQVTIGVTLVSQECTRKHTHSCSGSIALAVCMELLLESDYNKHNLHTLIHANFHQLTGFWLPHNLMLNKQRIHSSETSTVYVHATYSSIHLQLVQQVCSTQTDTHTHKSPVVQHTMPEGCMIG